MYTYIVRVNSDQLGERYYLGYKKSSITDSVKIIYDHVLIDDSYLKNDNSVKSLELIHFSVNSDMSSTVFDYQKKKRLGVKTFLTFNRFILK